MFYVSGTNISLTRGDSATLSVDLKTQDGEAYALDEGDTLVLTVKRSPNDEEIVLQLYADGEGVFTFLPSATEGLAFGNYRYDIQLTTSAGEVYTVIPVSGFTLLEEVTWPVQK